MKRYKLYKEVKPVHCNFEELLANIVLPLVIASYISYPVLYFLGTESAIIFNAFVALTANYFHKGVKKYLPAFNNNDSVFLSSGVFWFCSFIIIFIVLLIADFGFYLLILYQKKNEFNIFHFYSWLMILFGVPLLYYILKFGQYYFAKKYQDLEFINILLAVNHDLDFFLAVDNIQFVNTLNRKSSDIKITNNIRSYSQKEFMAMKAKSRHYYANKEGYREMVQIPFHANTVLLSWFSYVENKYYAVEIPFPFEKFIEEQKKCSIDKFKVFRGRETKPLYLHLYLNGGVKFFYKDVILIDSPENKHSPINEEYKKIKFGIKRIL
ncbi:hypothetical protein [Flavobacterium limi]|uniref:Uncharacterized protein n=1 Tax=Flavobacterium limi TaxID=2045105 RepID=A0ABQ1UN97_9FLAO|nr:hypothetical protein [Flavobacterium limi]GGF21329.1 hypothetical protein GCM10011518_33140 [Flavobacterium limi]